jgi:HEAT repeat protein
MGLPVPVWKVSTFASLGLAAFFAFRPAPPPTPKAHGAPSANAPPSTVDSRSFWSLFNGASQPAPAAAPKGARNEELLKRLAVARTVSEECSTLDDLARLDDTTATQAVVDVTQHATRSDLRTCATTALGSSHASLAASWLEELAHDRDTAVRDAALAGLAGSDDEAVRRVALGFAHSDDPKVRIAALEALGAAHVADATSLIADAIAQAHGDDRTALIEALGATRDPAALAALTKMASDPSNDVRRSAISSLATAGGADAVSALEALLASANASDAQLAVETLGQIPGAGAHAALLAAASDPRGEIAAAAVMAIGDDSSDDVRAVLRSVVSHAGPARGPALAQLISSPDTAAEARAILIHSINVDGGSSASGNIGILGRDDSDEARIALAEIARRGGSNAQEALSVLAGRDDPASRNTVAELAADTTHPAALEVLARAHDARAVPIALAAAQSSDTPTRSAALESLALVGGPDADRAIANAAASPDVETRRAAASAISNAEGSSPSLDALAQDADSEVARSAFGRLAIVDPARAETVMTTRFGAADPSARQDAVWFSAQLDGDHARPYLLAALRDPSADVVADACNRLGDVGGADAQTALYAVMTNPDSSPTVAAAAANALEQTDGAFARAQADAIARYRDAVQATAQPPDEATESSVASDDSTE